MRWRQNNKRPINLLLRYNILHILQVHQVHPKLHPTHNYYYINTIDLLGLCSIPREKQAIVDDLNLFISGIYVVRTHQFECSN